MLKHLNNLFQNPVLAWKEIDKGEYASPWELIKKNLSIFLIINPVLFFIIHLIFFSSVKRLLLQGLVYPFSLTLLSLVLLTFLGLLWEEIYRLTSFRDPGQNIFKLLVFSILPFYALSGFYSLPFVGKILFVTGGLYSLYLLKLGFEKFLWVNKSGRRKAFMISALFSVFLLTLFSGILIVFLRVAKNLIQKVV